MTALRTALLAITNSVVLLLEIEGEVFAPAPDTLFAWGNPASCLTPVNVPNDVNVVGSTELVIEPNERFQPKSNLQPESCKIIWLKSRPKISNTFCNRVGLCTHQVKQLLFACKSFVKSFNTMVLCEDCLRKTVGDL